MGQKLEKNMSHFQKKQYICRLKKTFEAEINKI